MSALPLPSRLGELEDVIERGLATFVEVGQALLEIRDNDLYRESHDTFEFYCRERWGFSGEYARLQMRAAEKATAPTIVGLPAVPSEAVARELPSEPEALREAWSKTVELHGPTPTAAQVREVLAPERTDVEPSVPFQSTSVEVFSTPAVPKTRGQLSNQSGGTDEWATPQDFYNVVNAEFGFDLDVCALDSSAKCPNYFTPEIDGLAQEWTGTVWMNPPYGDVIVNWVRKAWESAQAGATVVCLVPARTDTGWFQDYCLDQGEVRFLRGRLRFGDADASAPFPSCLVVLGPGVERTASGWDWR